MKPEPPERIYGWLDSQLSIAATTATSGFRVSSMWWRMPYDEKDQPLVRADVLKREAKAVRKAKQVTGTQESLL